MNAFPTRRACELEAQAAQHRWLIEPLWTEQAVGILGGEPKSCKSMLALELAVAVASGAPCLRRFPVTRPGLVLLFAGEDALHLVRSRLEMIARASEVDFGRLEVHLITAPALRIDIEEQRQRLSDTVAQLRPRLLVLDPFVRLHRIDENLAAEVAPLLAYLRELQRRFQTAVVLVHHARKTAHVRPGQALRGSSELHAWGDSNLYLNRRHHQLLLTVEHRAAPAPPPLALELRSTGVTLALDIVAAEESSAGLESSRVPERSPAGRVLLALSETDHPMTRRALRETSRMRACTVGQVLTELIEKGKIVEDHRGYRLSSTQV
jgi:hypothetical protein